MEYVSFSGRVCGRMKSPRAGRADRAPGRGRVGEGLLGGETSPAASYSRESVNRNLGGGVPPRNSLRNSSFFDRDNFVPKRSPFLAFRLRQLRECFTAHGRESIV